MSETTYKLHRGSADTIKCENCETWLQVSPYWESPVECPDCQTGLTIHGTLGDRVTTPQ